MSAREANGGPKVTTLAGENWNDTDRQARSQFSRSRWVGA